MRLIYFQCDLSWQGSASHEGGDVGGREMQP
jgi:hypothetical protein